MQTAEALSYEAIPSRFCENGDYAEISSEAADAFSFPQGLSPAFTTPGCFVLRQHVNAIGRIGTSAQALIQAGGLIGAAYGVSYGMYAVVKVFDGVSVFIWVSDADANDEPPPGGDSAYYTVMDSSEVEDGIPQGAGNWHRASAELGESFFDVP